MSHPPSLLFSVFHLTSLCYVEMRSPRPWKLTRRSRDRPDGLPSPALERAAPPMVCGWPSPVCRGPVKARHEEKLHTSKMAAQHARPRHKHARADNPPPHRTHCLFSPVRAPHLHIPPIHSTLYSQDLSHRPPHTSCRSAPAPMPLLPVGTIRRGLPTTRSGMTSPAQWSWSGRALEDPSSSPPPAPSTCW